MLIANPIYDVVFKYLMDDEKVAKLLLSALLGRQVEELHVRSTEHRSKIPSKDTIIVLRLDFEAKILLEDGSRKLVLIELQKARSAWDLERFRRYLGNQYSDPANHYVDERGKKVPLPIVSIYFLGEPLEHTNASVIKVERIYQDGITGEEITEPEQFIESLSHDSIIIQIPKLKARRRNELEALLSVFDQDRAQESNKHQILIQEEELPERYRTVLRRLQMAMAEPELLEEMYIQDEVVQALLEKDKALEAKDKALEEQAKALEEERKAKEEAQAALAEQARMIEELKRQLGQG